MDMCGRRLRPQCLQEGLPRGLAVGAQGFAGGAEPLVEAAAMEALGAGVAGQARQVAVVGSHNRVADDTLLHP